MKAKDLIKALSRLDPETDVKIIIKHFHKTSVEILDIKYGSSSNTGDQDYDDYNYFGTWVNNSFQGSITVHLPEGKTIHTRKK